MVAANLHMICGNCGSNSEFSHYTHPEKGKPVVIIACNNCSTLHDLDSNSKLEEKKYTSLYSYTTHGHGTVSHCSDGYIRNRDGKIIPKNE